MTDPNTLDVHRFVWHDFMSTEPDRTAGFLTELLGWRVETTRRFPPHGTYRRLAVGDVPVCGVVPLPKDGPPSHALAYFAVEDVGRAVEGLDAWGGSLLQKPRDIDGWGTFAVVREPTGGVFALFRGVEPYRPVDVGRPPVGHFAYEELLAADAARAEIALANAFELEVRVESIPGLGEYRLLAHRGRPVLGILPKPPEAAGPSTVLSYVRVEDPDAVWARVAGLGGAGFVPPTDLPSVGRFAVLGEPSGALLALFRPE